ncbi:pathogenesis-related protein 1C-like [Phoenix dactylifera]|uniref:Pathogenesis-related protein 1C-like n=1 Tax=Phoenix dactylifera TaxID=42345 RepID=A0A8B9AW04_PHODC|nr:pathogenesis-related protein 1C-like [Phoenix dactylifera]
MAVVIPHTANQARILFHHPFISNKTSLQLRLLRQGMAGSTLPLSLPLLLLLLPVSSPQLIPRTPLRPPPVSTPETRPPLTSARSSPVSNGGDTEPPTKPPGLVSFTGGKGSYKMMAHEFLKAHNEIRKLAGEKPYVWDKKLARYARRWAEQRREQCDTTHSHGPYGENMFWGTGWDWKAKEAVQNWAKEHLYYNRTERSCLPERMCGHFTQIVWNSTARVGCARVECYHGGVIISCNYEPPGNYVGEDPFSS